MSAYERVVRALIVGLFVWVLVGLIHVEYRDLTDEEWPLLWAAVACVLGAAGLTVFRYWYIPWEESKPRRRRYSNRVRMNGLAPVAEQEWHDAMDRKIYREQAARQHRTFAKGDPSPASDDPKFVWRRWAYAQLGEEMPEVYEERRADKEAVASARAPLPYHRPGKAEDLCRTAEAEADDTERPWKAMPVDRWGRW